MTMKSPYNREDGKRMLKSVVVFADVLGFSQEMQSAYEKGNPQELLDGFSEAIESSYSVLQDAVENSNDQNKQRFRSWEFKAFTDNIVIGFPISDDGEREMQIVLERLASFQLMMIRKGFFVRGGIAVGEHYMDSNIVFGRALIEAYKTEAEMARDPRIVLSPSAVSAAKDHLSLYTNTLSWHYNVVLKDSDGQLFLNYLDITRPRVQVEFEDFLDNIRMHKEIVLKKLEAFSDNPYVRSKYAWVANYHNFFCDQYSLESALKIDLELLQISPERIAYDFAKAAT